MSVRNYMKKEHKIILLAIMLVMTFAGLMIVSVKMEAATKKYAKKLSVNKTYVQLEAGEQEWIGYNVSIARGGNKKITIKNSNKKVVSAKVSGKKIVIRAKNDGESTITVVTKAKNKKGKKIAKKIQIIVKDEVYDYDYADDDMSGITQEKPTVNNDAGAGVKPGTTTKPGVTTAPGTTTIPEKESVPSISYQVHVQDTGWMVAVKDGEIAGTTGDAKRCEGIKINLADSKGNSMIQYRAYVQSVGWQEWKTSGQLAGTEQSSTRMEGIQIRLVGDYADKYDIYYSPHLRKYGWLGWAKNGEFAGSRYLSLQMEAIKIKLVRKNETFDVGGRHEILKPELTYQAHVGTVGWADGVSEGGVAGTIGESKRLEALIINFLDSNGASGVEYRAHCASVGWQDWKKSGEIAGTTSEARRMEAIEIKLTGSLAEDFDIYYRMHVAKIGWLGWAANGETAGTSGGARQAEAIEIKLVYKGAEVERGGKAYYELTIEQEQPGEKVLNINWNNINAVGKQTSGSQACSCFALAYCRTILDGRPRYWGEFNKYGGSNQGNVWAMWSWGNYTSNSTGNEQAVFQQLIANINAGKPVVVKVGGRCTPHYVAVVGYTNVTDMNSLSPNNFIIIDSGHLNGRGPELENMGACPFSLYMDSGNYQYCTSN